MKLQKISENTKSEYLVCLSALERMMILGEDFNISNLVVNVQGCTIKNLKGKKPFDKKKKSPKIIPAVLIQYV